MGLRRIRGASRRTARRIARARARLAFAAALLGAPIGEPALARPPSFVNPLAPFGLGNVERRAAPAFSDIDGDADLDAFVGDVDGNTVFFANTGTASAPAFAAPVSNPFGLAGVAYRAAPVFVDLDGDGDLDALVGEYSGNTLFFANTGTATAPAFAGPATNPFGLADVGIDAAPAFADLDGDGDLDAWVGERDGNTQFFANTGTAMAPAFAPPATNPFGLADVGYHAAPAFADLDGDGDLDAVVGEEYGSTVFFANTGTATAPAFAPPAANPFGLADLGSSYVSPELADLDGDGDLDAFVGERDGNTLLFANTGTATAPAFAGPATGPFGLTDVGYGASPVFADLDGDGDLDAFVGDWFGGTSFFENTGTARAPVFAPPESNPFGLSYVQGHASPAFADLDGDGDLDAFLGSESGQIHFFPNTGTASAPAFAPRVINPFGLGGVESYASPTFADLDGDGDLDAFVGEESGDVHFFENIGTASAPAFAPRAANPFGLSYVREYASPAFADLDGDGDLDAFVGDWFGDTTFFENTGTASAPAFAPPVTNPFGLAEVGWYSSPTFADLDGDLDLDAFLGLRSGWAVFFENLAALCPNAPEPSCTTGFGKATLSVDERKPGKEKLSAKLSKGPALAQSDFGDPTLASGTEVALCVYDDAGTRAATLDVDRAGESCGSRPCWKAIGKPPPDGKGFAYLDARGSTAGVRSIELRSGAAGKSSFALSASNKEKKEETALRTGIAAALAATTQVTLQVHTSDAACFEAAPSKVTKQESDLFKAR